MTFNNDIRYALVIEAIPHLMNIFDKLLHVNFFRSCDVIVHNENDPFSGTGAIIVRVLVKPRVLLLT